MEICTKLDVVTKKMEAKDSFALYFSDGICGVAESLYPKLETLFEQSFQRIPLYSVIAPMNPEIKGFFHVFTSPCLLVIIDGKETIRKAGNFGIEQLHKDVYRIYNLRFL